MELVNKNVKMLDPFSPNLTLEQKEAIRQECIVNPVYFYDRILGIKASRANWDIIRAMSTYPKDTPGDHDGDWLQDGFVCEPGIAAARRRTLGEDRRCPRMGELYQDTFLGSIQVVEEVPSFIDQWDKLAWLAWNITLVHFAHAKNPRKEVIQKRFLQEWNARAPEGVEVRVDWKDKEYSKPTFEFKRHGNADWVVKLPDSKERTSHLVRRAPAPLTADIEAGNRNWTQNQLTNKANQAWHLTCKNFDHQEVVLTNVLVIETFTLMVSQYDTGEYEVRLDSLIWNEQHPSIWKATPGFAYRKRDTGDWVKLDFTPSVRVPTTGFGAETMSIAELKERAVAAWNEVVKGNINRPLLSESQLECLFDKQIGTGIGYNRIKVEVRAGEPSFYYRVEDRWVTL